MTSHPVSPGSTQSAKSTAPSYFRLWITAR